MLRITCAYEDTDIAVLKLEGKLVDRWVALLEEVLDGYRDAERQLVLNLHSVSFADRQGADLLCRSQAAGVVLKGRGRFLEALCGQPKGKVAELEVTSRTTFKPTSASNPKSTTRRK